MVTVAEGLDCVRPALIRPPSLILPLEGGLWTKNHFLSVDMGGNSNCLEFPGLYNCNDSHSSQNFRCVQCYVAGPNFLVSLFASEMYLVSFDRSPNKYSEVAGTVATLHNVA